MASSDVIELGSSDDDAEPVPKRKKPAPNAMVRFPNEVPGLVIKPVKPAVPNLQKVLAGGAITIIKKNKAPTYTNKSKPNGRPVQSKSLISLKAPFRTPAIRQIPMTPIQVKTNLSGNQSSLMKNSPSLRVHPKLSLPPGIIVKRAGISKEFMQNAKPNIKRHHPQKIITTVDLDDDEVPFTASASPQWYLRPEEQTDEPAKKEKDESQDQLSDAVEENIGMEVENNKEPDISNYIEITIEDSPIKPLHVRKGFEVGTEIPITIEDSPVKPLKSGKEQPCVTDSETETMDMTEPHSKKKLDYQNDENDSTKAETQSIVEVDFALTPTTKDDEKSEDESLNVNNNSAVDKDVQKGDAPKREPTVLLTKDLQKGEKTSDPDTSGLSVQKDRNCEFHPIYQKFIDICFELENSDDMKKIVEKKIKTYYRQCPKEYVESEEFIDMVSSKICAMKAAPDKMYLYIKDIVDELNLQRKSAKVLDVANKENKKAENEEYIIEEDSEFDNKRRRQIRKLEKTIKKLHRAIQKLEEQEVEFEDEEDSVYLLTERYKERLIRVHAKFCQLTNTKMPSEPRIQIEPRPGQPLGPARRLEKWVNKKVPIGTPLPFPDFHDVLRCVREANNEDGLGWNEAEIMEEARDLFTRCGKKLQRRRQENEWRIAAARISHNASSVDPAEKNGDLKKKLEENKSVAAKKETEVLNKYADKQNQLKLVGEEIGDKEAEESPVESEDDEGNDGSNSLEDKEKRKERLKRLLHEKTKKQTSEKENIFDVESKLVEEENICSKDDVVEREEGVALDKTENKEQEDKCEDNTEVEVIVSESTENNTAVGPSDAQKVEKSNDPKQDEDSSYKNHENSYSDINDFDSDIDELHLLQKLYSENEINSSTQESGSDTPIAISDTLESDSDTEKKDDIISIENSSYSESEISKDECSSKTESEIAKDKRVDSLLCQNTEIQICSPLRDKVDIEQDNISLASTGNDDDKSTNFNTDKIEEITNDTTILDDNIDTNDGVVYDICDDNSFQNNITTHEVTNTNEVSIEYNYDVDIIDNSIQISEQQDLLTIEDNLMEVDEPINTKDSIEKGKDIIEVTSISSSIGSGGNDVLTNEIASDEVVSAYTQNEVIENDVDVSNKSIENDGDSNSIDNLVCTDKIESEEIVKDELAEHNFKECKTIEISKSVGENDECQSSAVNTVFKEKDLNACGDINNGVRELSDNKQTACEE